MVHLQVLIICSLISRVTSKAFLYSSSLIRGKVMFTSAWQRPAEGAQVSNRLTWV